MIILMDAENAFDKIQHSIKIKTLSKLEIKENNLNLTKYLYKKPTTYIILNGEKNRHSSLRTEMRQKKISLVNILLTVLNNAKGKQKAYRLGRKN